MKHFDHSPLWHYCQQVFLFFSYQTRQTIRTILRPTKLPSQTAVGIPYESSNSVLEEFGGFPFIIAIGSMGLEI